MDIISRQYKDLTYKFQIQLLRIFKAILFFDSTVTLIHLIVHCAL